MVVMAVLEGAAVQTIPETEEEAPAAVAVAPIPETVAVAPIPETVAAAAAVVLRTIPETEAPAEDR